jgi:hypothetical protein
MRSGSCDLDSIADLFLLFDEDFVRGVEAIRAVRDYPAACSFAAAELEVDRRAQRENSTGRDEERQKHQTGERNRERCRCRADYDEERRDATANG